MATYKRISDLTAASVLDGSELLEAVQASQSVKVTPAQIETYLRPNGDVASAYTITGSYVFHDGSYPDKSAAIVSGATVIVTACSALTREMTANVRLSDAGTAVLVNVKPTAGSVINCRIGASWADGGTNLLNGTFTFPTDGNAFYVNAVTGTVVVFDIVSFRTGA